MKRWIWVREIGGAIIPQMLRLCLVHFHLQDMGDFLTEMVAMMDQTKPSVSPLPLFL